MIEPKGKKIMKTQTKTTRSYSVESKSEKASWFFTHFLYVINEKFFQFDFGY